MGPYDSYNHVRMVPFFYYNLAGKKISASKEFEYLKKIAREKKQRAMLPPPIFRQNILLIIPTSLFFFSFLATLRPAARNSSPQIVSSFLFLFYEYKTLLKKRKATQKGQPPLQSHLQHQEGNGQDQNYQNKNEYKTIWLVHGLLNSPNNKPN